MPTRCPECGRFLSRDFVAALADGPASCPGCATELTADRFADADIGAAEPTSVRPPDLPVEELGTEDVLAGWDEPPEGMPGPLTELRDIFPPDRLAGMLVVLGAGVAGGVLGGLILRRHRSFGAFAGTIAGAVGALVGSGVLADDRR